MKPQEKIFKALNVTFDAIKDATERNIIVLASRGELKVDKDEIPKIVKVVKISIDEGFQQSYVVMKKSITKILDDFASDVKAEGGGTQTKSSKSKKG